jgi:hypothetical protein
VRIATTFLGRCGCVIGEFRGIAALSPVDGLQAVTVCSVRSACSSIEDAAYLVDSGASMLGPEVARLDQHRADAERGNLRGQRLHPALHRDFDAA